MLFDSYLDYFENLAVQNKTIAHVIGDVNTSCFEWILVSSDPFPNYYLDHLTDAQRNRLPIDRPFVIVENYIAEPDVINEGDNKTEMMGAFIIMEKAREGDIANEKEVLARTERVARQFIGRMKLDMMNQCLIELPNKFKYEHVGPFMSQYFGTKVYFSFKDDSLAQYDIDGDDWEDLS